MIHEVVEELDERFKYFSYQPLLVELTGKADFIRQWALKKALSKLNHLPEEDQRVIEQMSRLMMRKILRDPILRLRQAAEDGFGEEAEMKNAMQELFNLTEASEENA